MDLLLSSGCPSFLLPALPFAFVSSSLNYIPNILLRESAAPPSSHIVKRFYKPHVQQIKKQLDDVTELGAASADEWSKGLPAEGKERINDAIRWEQWEAKGGLKKVNTRPQARVFPINPIATTPTQGLAKPHNDVRLNASAPQIEQMIPPCNIPASTRPMVYMNTQQYPQNPPRKSRLSQENGQYRLNVPCKALYHVPWINTGPFQEPPAHRIPAPIPVPRPERNIKDVNEAKAARRAEIERRCSLFDPPLLPHILNHMESFQAAIQISTPLTDFAWDLLESRLLTQRAGAERKDLERVQQNELLQSELKQRRHHDGHSKDSKESVDRHWDSVQAPVRDRLGLLADAAIDQRWSGGGAVTKDTCPQFAADMLLCVRQQFYDEVTRSNEVATTSGQPIKSDTPNGPPTQTLTLENMKWLFDTKIKPITENFQRELFLCNGCDDNYKYYGFEGVIQHYAAKHTTSLSMGSIVVYWRAEWPDEPPFNPEPSLSKSYYKVPSPATAGLSTWNGIDHQLYHPSSSGYGANIEGNLTQNTDGISTQPNASYNSSQAMSYPDTMYSAPYYPAYPPASVPVAIPNGLSNGYARSDRNGHPPHWQGNTAAPAPPHAVGGQDLGVQYAGYNYPSTINPQGSAPGMAYAAQAPAPAVAPAVVQAVAPRPPHFDPSRNNAAQLTEGYQQQMNEMAKQAREVWYSTSSIKDLPASVRIYVVIHHMAARFAAKFSTVPSLAMFLDGLDNNAQMRPVRSLNGLACKTCVTEQNARITSDSQSQPPAGDRRLYTLPHLLNHFRTAHLESPQAFVNPNSSPDSPKYDWTRDMIELPESRLIAGLVHSSGMDDNRLEMIAWAFPGVFPSPLPKLSALRNPGPVPNFFGNGPSIPAFKDGYANGLGHPRSNAVPESTRDRADATAIKGPQSGSRPLSRLSRASESPGEDEYDPHKPIYHGKPVMTGASIERANVRTNYTPDGANEWHERSHHRQFPETTDLSKLLYSATQLQSNHRRPGHGYDGQLDSEIREPSPPFYKSERDESASITSPYGGRKTVEDDRRQNEGPTGFYMPEGVMPTSSGNIARSPVPSAGARAAEQILQRLGQTSVVGASHRLQNYEQSSQFSPKNEWTGGSHVQMGEKERQYVVDPVSHAGYETAPLTREMGPVSPIHPSRPEPKNVRDTSHSQVQTSEAYHHANYQRAASNGRSHAYLEYSTPHPAMVEDRHLRNGYSVEQLDSSRNSSRIPQVSHYRDRPRSPVPIALDSTYYRPRSPAEELQPQQVYRVRSPRPRTEDRVQRIVYESPRQDRFEYVDEHEYAPSPQNRYAQRIEYVPVRMGNQSPPNSSRYFIAQPVDPRGRADYVPLEETYDQGAVYERDGQLYRAAPRAYQTPIARGNAGSPSSYPY